MNRIVYLFELDSAKKFDLEDNNIIYETDGVRKLFREIINNGNIVAISMNQLADSHFFAQAVYDDFTYPILCSLFELGALRVSLYGTTRTASQYIQQSIQKCLENNDDSFVFSNLSVSYDEKELLQIIQNSLKYSDLSKLHELRDSSTGMNQQKYEHICRYVDMILKLSANETSNIPPKTQPSKNFETFLNTACKILKEHTFADNNFDIKIKGAIKEISQRSLRVTENRQNRSNWLYLKDGSVALSFVATEIINLCYNYTVEDSINGVTKSYINDSFDISFTQDLIRRIDDYSKKINLCEPKVLSKRKWKMLLRFAKYRQTKNVDDTACYEKNILREQRKWKFKVFGKVMGSCGWTLIYIALFLLTDLLVNWVEGHINLPFNNIIFSSVMSILFVGIVSSLIDMIISKLFNKGMPDILENLHNIYVRIIDLYCVILGGKNDIQRKS